MFTYSCIRKAREQFLKQTFYTAVLVNVGQCCQYQCFWSSEKELLNNVVHHKPLFDVIVKHQIVYVVDHHFYNVINWHSAAS